MGLLTGTRAHHRPATSLIALVLTLASVATCSSALGKSSAPAQQSGALPAARRHCSSPSSTGTAPSQYDTTPRGPGPWHVPRDPCNTEANGRRDMYGNCAYWAAEKRPDIWVNAVWIYGYPKPYGGWDVELDARKAGYPINHVPHVGDIAAWPPNALIGIGYRGGKSPTVYQASPGGHVAYVERVNGNSITISEMGTAGVDGGVTLTFEYEPKQSWFIHHL